MSLFAIGVVLALASGLRAQTTHRVELAGMSFTPANTTIAVGDTVRWVWIFGFHNVESGLVVGVTPTPDGNFRSGDPTLTAGTTFELVFDQAFLDSTPIPGNAYPYYCIVHAGFGMAGTITVALAGDIDGDADVDLADHKAQATCINGPSSTVAPVGCSGKQFDRSDIDGDNDVDLRDVAAMQLAFSG